MTKVVLIRHARSSANASAILAGRLPGVGLDDVGRDQAAALMQLLRGITPSAVYTSPLQRCRETAELAGWADAEVIEELTECDYGSWSGRPLDELRGLPVWEEIQRTPSTVAFPDGESMTAMAERVVAAEAGLAARHGDGDVIAVFSHGDPLKAVLADALGLSLDDFQRLHVGPAGVSVIDYSGPRPMVLCVNSGSGVAGLVNASHGAPTVGGGDIPK